MATPLWTESFRVRSYETDPGGFASMVSVCNYLQEAAANHARALGVSMEQLEASNSTWVLARLRVEVGQYPQWRDEVVVETWPSGTERLFATREFLVRLDDGGSILARGTSAWLMIDRARRRPVRLPEFITNLERPDRDRALMGTDPAIPEAGPDADVCEIRARYGDMDVNGHVNNVRYIEWAMEPVSPDILGSRRIARLDVQFKSEAVFGDAVIVAVESVGVEDAGVPAESVFGDAGAARSGAGAAGSDSGGDAGAARSGAGAGAGSGSGGDAGAASETVRSGDTDASPGSTAGGSFDVAGESVFENDIVYVHTIRHAGDGRELTRLRTIWHQT